MLGSLECHSVQQGWSALRYTKSTPGVWEGNNGEKRNI